MVRHSVASLLLAAIAALAGCVEENVASSPSIIEGQEETTPPVAVEDGSSPVGTFRAQEVGIGEVMLLVLKTDGTAHWGMAILCAAKPESCGPVQEDGHYRLTQRESGNTLDLLDWKGNLRASFQYALTNDHETLRLRRVDTGGQWRSMKRSEPAWCAAADDCALQNTPVSRCIGAWSCAENACNHQCEPRPCDAQDDGCEIASSTHLTSQQ